MCLYAMAGGTYNVSGLILDFYWNALTVAYEKLSVMNFEPIN
jgi:hypothetical protein